MAEASMNVNDVGFVKNYLRIDYDEDDAFVSGMIIASKSFVETYLNRKLDTDFNDDGTYSAEIDFARLHLMSQWFETRTIMSPRSNVNEMKYVFEGLLDPHRYWQFGFIGGYSVEDNSGSAEDILFDKKTGLFYRANQVDTYTAITGDDDRSNAQNTAFIADKDSVDYNQKARRGEL